MGAMIGRITALLRPSEATPTVIEVRHAGERFGVEVRRSAQARRLILRVRGATRDAVLTIPKRTSMADARDFAERQAAWISARLRRLPETIYIEAGAIIPLRGAPTRIVSHESRRGTVWLDGAREPTLCVAGDPRHQPRRLIDWLRRECRRDIERAVSDSAAKLGHKPPPITLRDTATRWGSCTAAGKLNFSWRLILAPPFVLDYLAAHEVSHLVRMDHSPQFWALCRRLNADTDRAEAWLNANGASLHRYRMRAKGE